MPNAPDARARCAAQSNGQGDARRQGGAAPLTKNMLQSQCAHTGLPCAPCACVVLGVEGRGEMTDRARDSRAEHGRLAADRTAGVRSASRVPRLPLQRIDEVTSPGGGASTRRPWTARELGRGSVASRRSAWSAEGRVATDDAAAATTVRQHVLDALQSERQRRVQRSQRGSGSDESPRGMPAAEGQERAAQHDGINAASPGAAPPSLLGLSAERAPPPLDPWRGPLLHDIFTSHASSSGGGCGLPAEGEGDAHTAAARRVREILATGGAVAVIPVGQSMRMQGVMHVHHPSGVALEGTVDVALPDCVDAKIDAAQCRMSGSIRSGELCGATSSMQLDGIGEYQGEVADGLPHGEGEWRAADGGIYIGQWERGSRSGSGEQTYDASTAYRGQWQANAPHGTGALRTDDSQYEGGWHHGVPDGSGRLSCTSPAEVCYEVNHREGQLASRSSAQDAQIAQLRRELEAARASGNRLCKVCMDRPVDVVQAAMKFLMRTILCQPDYEVTKSIGREIVGVVMLMELPLVVGFAVPFVTPLACLAAYLSACAFHAALRMGMVLTDEARVLLCWSSVRVC